ncbi:MAG: cache domain-containing protein [Pseudomonadota bacterium]
MFARMFITVFLCALFTDAASAAHRSSAAEAKAHLEKATAFYKKEGHDSALAAFNQKDGEFTQRDLYVFAIDTNGRYLALGLNPMRVGVSMRDMLDAAGNSLYGMFMRAVGQNPDLASASYVWLNPQTNQVENKTSYLRQLDDVILGVGYYN